MQCVASKFIDTLKASCDINYDNLSYQTVHKSRDRLDETVPIHGPCISGRLMHVWERMDRRHMRLTVVVTPIQLLVASSYWFPVQELIGCD